MFTIQFYWNLSIYLSEKVRVLANLDCEGGGGGWPEVNTSLGDGDSVIRRAKVEYQKLKCKPYHGDFPVRGNVQCGC